MNPTIFFNYWQRAREQDPAKVTCHLSHEDYEGMNIMDTDQAL